MLLILLGVICGILSGLFGIGGGSVYVPALVIFFQHTQQQAQGISLLVMIPTALLGSMVYFRNDLVLRKGLPVMMLGVAIGSLGGSTLANVVHSAILSKLFSLILLYFGYQMMTEK